RGPDTASGPLRFQARSAMRRRGLLLPLLLQMLAQEVHGPLPSGLRAVRMKASTLVAMEAVLGLGIDEDFRIAAAFLLDGLDVGHGDRRFFPAKMHKGRLFRPLVGFFCVLPAVIADGGREAVELAGGEKGDGAAHAEAHDGDWAVLLEV